MCEKGGAWLVVVWVEGRGGVRVERVEARVEGVRKRVKECRSIGGRGEWSGVECGTNANWLGG